MLQFIRHKISNKKLLNFCLLVGVVLLSAFLCVYPMFRQGSLDRLLRTLFTSHSEETKRFPAVLSKHATLTDDEFNGIDEIMDYMDEFENVWTSYIDVPVVKSQRIFHCPGGSADFTFGTKTRPVSLGYIPDIDKYADTVYGVGADNAQSSDNDMVLSALARGDIPCVISQSLMDKYKIVPGESISFKFRLKDTESVTFVVTGIIEEKQNDGYFWHDRLADYADTLFVSGDDYEKLVFDNKLHETYFDFNSMLDYSKISSTKVAQYEGFLREFRELDHEYTDNILSTFEEYDIQERAISIILFTFELPIIALLLLFLYMISDRILEMETTEIAMLKSRGTGRPKIIGLYIVQSSIISAVGCLIGLPTGFGLCRLAGSTNGFLTFSLKDVSIYKATPLMILFALIAFALAVMFMTLPVIGLSKLTITMRRNKKVSVNTKPFWEKYFIDLGLLALSGYFLYNYYRQKDILALQVLEGKGVDPVIFLDSSLFIISCGLLLLRLSGYFVRLIFRLGKNHWSPAGYVGFLQIIRNSKKQGFISVFLVMTIAMGLFNANLARTVNENLETRLQYNSGCDLRILEKWKLVTKSRAVGDTVWSYKETDYELYKMPEDIGVEGTTSTGVESITRVLIDDNTDITVGKKIEKGNTLMGINTKEFGQTATLPDGVTSEHWYNYLNALALEPKGVIISENLASKYNLKVGDSIKYSRYSPINTSSPYVNVSAKVCAIAEAFPGFESIIYEEGENGEIKERENYLIVANYATVTSNCGLTPYKVWMRLNRDADTSRIIDTLTSRGIEIKDVSSLDADIQEQRNSAMIQITNGMFSIGFFISLLICSIGFMIYWVLTIKEREMIYGIYRAMGMSMKEIVKILVIEQVFGSLLSALAGFGVGALTTFLFTKLIAIVYLPRKHNIPIDIFVEPGDIYKITLIFAAAFIICFIIMRRTLKNMNITKALKMGAD